LGFRERESILRVQSIFSVDRESLVKKRDRSNASMGLTFGSSSVEVGIALVIQGLVGQDVVLNEQTLELAEELDEQTLELVEELDEQILELAEQVEELVKHIVELAEQIRPVVEHRQVHTFHF